MYPGCIQAAVGSSEPYEFVTLEVIAIVMSGPARRPDATENEKVTFVLVVTSEPISTRVLCFSDNGENFLPGIVLSLNEWEWGSINWHRGYLHRIDAWWNEISSLSSVEILIYEVVRPPHIL